MKKQKKCKIFKFNVLIPASLLYDIYAQYELLLNPYLITL